MLTLIVNAVKEQIREQKERAQLRELLDKDDRLLRDAGLTRADIESALNKPLGLSARKEAYRLSALSLRLDRA
ncbi:MAG: DUF1127 domain-containing protein [Pseudomonadota bacterium]